MTVRVNAQDIVGNRQGNIVILVLLGRCDNHIYYECICDCGSEFIATRNKILDKYSPLQKCSMCARRENKRRRVAHLNTAFKRKPGKTRTNNG